MFHHFSRAVIATIAMLMLSLSPAIVYADDAPNPSSDPPPAPESVFPAVDPDIEARHKRKGLGFSITPGIGVRLLDIDVRSKADGSEGLITNDGSFFGPMYATISVESPVLLLSKKVGLTVRAHASKFTLDTQRVKSQDGTSESGGDLTDLDTEVSGHYSYLMPTIFYRVADPSGEFRTGLGYGQWKIRFSGDIILSKDETAAESTPATEIDDSETKAGALLFFQWRGRRAMFEIAFNRMDFSSSDFDYELDELNMVVGYQIYF